MAEAESLYPWFQRVEGPSLEQGDIIERCPVFSPPADLPHDFDKPGQPDPDFGYQHLDVIVMTQSCDLLQGKAREVLLCPVWTRSDYKNGPLSKTKDWEEARKGKFPAYHVLNECVLPDFKRDHRVVDFRDVYTLPVAFLGERADGASSRVRLMPPYREHLAQSFARFFMRVGLPSDIPPFR